MYFTTQENISTLWEVATTILGHRGLDDAYIYQAFLAHVYAYNKRVLNSDSTRDSSLLQINIAFLDELRNIVNENGFHEATKTGPQLRKEMTSGLQREVEMHENDFANFTRRQVPPMVQFTEDRDIPMDDPTSLLERIERERGYDVPMSVQKIEPVLSMEGPMETASETDTNLRASLERRLTALETSIQIVSSRLDNWCQKIDHLASCVDKPPAPSSNDPLDGPVSLG
jgi:hypothetical protein